MFSQVLDQERLKGLDASIEAKVQAALHAYELSLKKPDFDFFTVAAAAAAATAAAATSAAGSGGGAGAGTSADAVDGDVKAEGAASGDLVAGAGGGSSTQKPAPRKRARVSGGAAPADDVDGGADADGASDVDVDEDAEDGDGPAKRRGRAAVKVCILEWVVVSARAGARQGVAAVGWCVQRLKDLVGDQAAAVAARVESNIRESIRLVESSKPSLYSTTWAYYQYKVWPLVFVCDCLSAFLTFDSMLSVCRRTLTT